MLKSYMAGLEQYINIKNSRKLVMRIEGGTVNKLCIIENFYFHKKLCYKLFFSNFR
jgi:hypothetical protein